MNDFIEDLTQKIPLDRIGNPERLIIRIQSLLKSHGYGEMGPECHIEVTISGRTLITRLIQVGGGKLEKSRSAKKIDGPQKGTRVFWLERYLIRPERIPRI
jgi:hypothetical protein